MVLSISKKDESIIDGLKTLLKTNKPTRYSKNGDKEYCRFVIENKKIVSDLIKIGLYSNKTQTIDIPNIDINLIRHFIRGYFDGDGSVTLSKGSVKISIISNIKMVSSIQKILMNECDLNKTKFTVRRKESPNIVTMSYGGNIQTKRIYEYLYNGSTVFLERKRDRILNNLKMY